MSTQPANPALTRALNEADPFRESIGYAFVRNDEGGVEVRLTIELRHRNRAGFLHGAIAALLLPAAGAVAVYTAAPDVTFAVNASMSISYMRGIREGTLIATGGVDHLGTTLAHVRMRLVAAGALDAPLATAHGVYRLRR